MKITVLGSGSNAPVRKRGMAGYIVEADGKRLFVDMGPGCFYKLLKKGIKVEKIENVFITHCHWDHICDLMTVLFSKAYHKLKQTPINIYCPAGIKRILGTMFELSVLATPKCKIKITELKKSELKVGKIRISTVSILHSKKLNSICYRISFKGNSVVFTGDYYFCEKNLKTLSRFAKNCDLLITDSSFGEREKCNVHPRPRETAKILDAVMPKSVLLSHLFPSAADSDLINDVRKNCKEFNGKIIKARDFMEMGV
ncbi:ribonuclease Z [Candidatus Woesearchaeota archaeon]|nr:ribonuclease Z [Candidatus Woesearchaeota archaeon]